MQDEVTDYVLIAELGAVADLIQTAAFAVESATFRAADATARHSAYAPFAAMDTASDRRITRQLYDHNAYLTGYDIRVVPDILDNNRTDAVVELVTAAALCVEDKIFDTGDEFVSDLVHDHVAAGVPVQLSDIVIAVITTQLDVCMGIGRDNV